VSWAIEERTTRNAAPAHSLGLRRRSIAIGGAAMTVCCARV
jgi:hypothetical protein